MSFPDDDDVVLNLAGLDAPPAARPRKERPGSKWERRQKKVALSQAQALQARLGKRKQGPGETPSSVPSAPQLKGYSLPSPAPAAPEGGRAGRPAEEADDAPLAEGKLEEAKLQPLLSRKRQRVGPAVQEKAGRAVEEDGSPEEAAEKPAGKASKPVEGLEDILSAVAANRQKDARLRESGGTTAAGHEREGDEYANEEWAHEELGRISFVDERRPLKPATRRPRPEDDLNPGPAPGERPKKLRFARGPETQQPKRGELARAERPAVPATEQEAVFGVGDPSGDPSTFRGLGLDASLAEHLEEINFVTPTRVQRAAIPVLLRGRDALVNAPTGSGKTLVYLAPIIHDLQGRIPRVTRESGTLALIILPTRELCLQVADVLALVLRRYHFLVGGAIFGGEKRAGEKARLRRGVNILAGTPGRLLDHLANTASFRTADLKWLVLDEADRLLDQGFQAKIGEILEHLQQRSTGGAQRQTVMLSATLHSKLSALASVSLRDPEAVGFSISSGAAGGLELGLGGPSGADGEGRGVGGGREEEAGGREQPSEGKRGEGLGNGQQQFQIPSQLTQHFVEVPCKHRLAALAGLVRRLTAAPAAKLVVFLSTCDGVEFHHAALADVVQEVLGEPLLDDCRLHKLHGNLPQGERTKAFLHFTRCRRGVLLCTDVAARGLDFPAVTAILQFDPPGEPSEYVHRVGRTARMGQAGVALLVLLPSERAYLARLATLNVHLAALPLAQALERLQADPKAAGSGPMRTSDFTPEPSAPSAMVALSNGLVEAVSESPDLVALASAAFRAHVRSYATHPAALKDIFHIRRLHLGHLAHAFGLRESPSMAGKSLTKTEKLKDQAKGKAKGREKLQRFKAGPLAGKLPLRKKRSAAGGPRKTYQTG